ncbi:hypothetical protein [Acinetobacter sp. Marseille-Q1618]|uniref:hypothetical protein n=1 Tax=Acinetobacter sp. Marseille-Q1618 TaxID=2697502 RepID=UPI00156FA6D4|nr:hypothetical protein [Acinetobacter sp. Marseille-Q1618]
MIQQKINWNTILQKSNSGRAILTSHASKLSRAERNILIIANGRLTAKEIVVMLGIPFHTIDVLLETQLLEVSDWGDNTQSYSNEEQDSKLPAQVTEKLNIELPLLENSSAFHRTYAFLSIQIPEFFGLLSFTQILKLEKASDLNELTPLIQNLLNKVQKKYGDLALNAYQNKFILLSKELDAN